jgi:hypothetical protein
MLQLKRPQVKAMLDIISKDNTRPAIENAKVVKYGDKLYLTGTDGYVMFMLEVEDDSLQGRTIYRSYIETWYKLASGKDYLTEEVLEGMTYNDDTFPDITPIVDRALVGADSDKIGFNADYAKKIQALFASDGLTFKLNGILGAMVHEQTGDNSGYGILMPLKVK